MLNDNQRDVWGATVIWLFILTVLLMFMQDEISFWLKVFTTAAALFFCDLIITRSSDD